MKTLKIISMFLVLVLLTTVQANAWQITCDNRLGAATYEEKDDNIDSDWSAFWYEAVFGLNNFDKENLELGAKLGVFVTPAAEETWDINGAEYQTNDMELWGVEPSLQAGWAFNPNDKFCLTPFLGYGFKRISFDRTNFNILNTITSREVVSEDYNIHHMDFGVGLNYELRENLSLFSSASYGFVISNEADNSVLGKMDGDGGYLGKFELGANYILAENLSLTVSGFAELEHLEGGSTDAVIWPDNDLNAFGGNIGLKCNF